MACHFCGVRLQEFVIALYFFDRDVTGRGFSWTNKSAFCPIDLPLHLKMPFKAGVHRLLMLR